MTFIRRTSYALALILGLASLAAAQSQKTSIWQQMKDAANQAKQQKSQQQTVQQAPPKVNQPINTASGQPLSSNSEPPNQSGSAATGADCCTPEAMKTIAASLGFVDIVGIKLGMTPAQAVAAVKAYNPNLKIETLTARLEHPVGTAGNFVRVPHTINAYTANSRQDLGPVEWIAMQFTQPPGPPLLVKVQRFTGFLASQPVMEANLLQSLRKKYGQENRDGGDHSGWVYDSNGKLLTRVANEQANCVDDGAASAVPGSGSGPHAGGETGAQINLSLTSDSSRPEETKSACAHLVWVAARGVGSGFAPNSQQLSMTVTMESGALAYMSTSATHNWLQAEADAKIKEDDKAAAGRSAPKL